MNTLKFFGSLAAAIALLFLAPFLFRSGEYAGAIVAQGVFSSSATELLIDALTGAGLIAATILFWILMCRPTLPPCTAGLKRQKQ